MPTVAFLLVAAFVWFGMGALHENPPRAWLFFGAAALAAGGLAASILRRRGRDRRIALDRVRQAARRHLRTLAIKRRQLVVADEYGVADFTRWDQHLRHFVENVAFGRPGTLRRPTAPPPDLSKFWPDLVDAIEKLLDEYDGRAGSAPGFDQVRTGVDYEHFCKGLLESEGWRVATTPASGDQGADLIAEREGERVVIQCKLYGQPVGNKAVQEAFSARHFQRAQHAAVVSNSSYTPAAQQLAALNGVLLLHHDQLTGLIDRIAPARR